MLRQLLIQSVILSLIMTTSAGASGSMAVVLTDAQLDAISAGGLNLTFDSMLGSINAATESATSSAIASLNPANYGAKVYGGSNPAFKVVIVPATPATPLTTASVLAPQVPSVQAAAAAPDTDATSPVSDFSAAAVDVPQKSVDFVASLDDQGHVGLISNSEAIPVEFSTINGNINSIVLSDMAQQNMSSFVSVNAAGSIVPVQINFTVLINSTVQSITNNNTLSINQFLPYLIQ
ncbi:MAG: hypothetical protein HQL17_01110 [Candidatus Omnitrophica bacterium]|nr:hypothetical protein [Candidatus Omnitrophota bacterium]